MSTCMVGILAYNKGNDVIISVHHMLHAHEEEMTKIKLVNDPCIICYRGSRLLCLIIMEVLDKLLILALVNAIILPQSKGT